MLSGFELYPRWVPLIQANEKAILLGEFIWKIRLWILTTGFFRKGQWLRIWNECSWNTDFRYEFRATACLHLQLITSRRALWELCVSKMASSLSSSMEGTGFSDSDMSADESSSSVAQREKNLIARLKQENRVLKMELETCKLRCKQLQEENRALRQASVSIVSCAVINIHFSFTDVGLRGKNHIAIVKCSLTFFSMTMSEISLTDSIKVTSRKNSWRDTKRCDSQIKEKKGCCLYFIFSANLSVKLEEFRHINLQRQILKHVAQRLILFRSTGKFTYPFPINNYSELCSEFFLCL